MASECEKLLKNLKRCEGALGKAICKLGCGGDVSVYLHELSKNGLVTKVAVKSITKQDLLWQK